LTILYVWIYAVVSLMFLKLFFLSSQHCDINIIYRSCQNLLAKNVINIIYRSCLTWLANIVIYIIYRSCLTWLANIVIYTELFIEAARLAYSQDCDIYTGLFIEAAWLAYSQDCDIYYLQKLLDLPIAKIVIYIIYRSCLTCL
jgi:hypothetical protein